MNGKKIFVSLGILIAVTVLVGVTYKFATRIDSQPGAASTSVGVGSPNPSSTSPEPIPSKDLRIGDLSITYPADWLILFSPILDAKAPNITPIYFVRNLTEYREHALCASTGSCTTTPLTITFSPRTNIWTGYSLGDYIRTTNPDYPLDELVETQLGEFVGLAGYTDYLELTYQALIPTSETTFQQITITATEDSRDLLASFIDSLSTATIIDSNLVTDPTKLSAKHAYTLKLSARLATTDYNILALVLDNILQPSESSASANYILYTETSTPPDNYLDYTYSLLTDNTDLVPDDYSTSQITATLTEAPIANFVPYLESPKYCSQNSDCVYRSNFCNFDAYNRYHLFQTSRKCSVANYAGLGNSTKLLESLDCGRDETIDITYDSLECVDNQCVAHNPVPVCVEE